MFYRQFDEKFHARFPNRACFFGPRAAALCAAARSQEHTSQTFMERLQKGEIRMPPDRTQTKETRRARQADNESNTSVLDDPPDDPRPLARRAPPCGEHAQESPKLTNTIGVGKVYFPHVHTGELSERLKEHDWKSCRRQKRLRGSNPRLSASAFRGVPGRHVTYWRGGRAVECGGLENR